MSVPPCGCRRRCETLLWVRTLLFVKISAPRVQGGGGRSKTNSAPGHDGGVNEESDAEGVQDSDEDEEDELDEQDEEDVDQKDVEEPDNQDEVGGDGPPLSAPLVPVPVPVLVWDSDLKGGRAFSCPGGVSWGRISIILNKAIGRPKSFSVYCTRHGCQFARPLDRRPSRDEMLDWFVRGQSLPKERDVWVKERHRGMWPEP